MKSKLGACVLILSAGTVLAGGSGLVLGDSTVATYAGGLQIVDFLHPAGQPNGGWSAKSIAVPGHTIAQQKAVYLATTNRAEFDYTLIQIGLNDLKPDEAPGVAIARLQDLVNTVNANKKAGTPTVIATMIPARQRLVDIYGADKGPVSQRKFLEINRAIKGEGKKAITGVTSRISRHTELLDDGKGNLGTAYDTGDHIHENDKARRIIAKAWHDALVKLNLLK